jgi:glycosyltransferase involved in cell wall biosynthesis
MTYPFSVSVIIPAYNEAASIGQVVRAIRQLGPAFEIVVVDDGSQDATAQLAHEAGASRVISHPYNIGNGASVKTGARAVTGDVVLMIDADGQHPPENIPLLLEKMNDYAMAVGARTRQSDVSRFRAVGNELMRHLAMYLTESYIMDLTSGFRAIRRNVLLEYIHLFPNTYSYPTTITMCLLKDGYPVAWQPMDSIGRRKTGRSGIRPLRDGLRFVAIMVRIIMLFSPQRVFLPAGMAILLFGLWLSAFTIQRDRLEASAVLVVMIGVFVLLFGLIAEQLSTIRRELNKRL